MSAAPRGWARGPLLLVALYVAWGGQML